jgi:hypothetical protein
MRIDRWSEPFDMALWFRAAERIDVPAGGVVPAALDIDPLPEPSQATDRAADLTRAWLAWWHALTGAGSPSGSFDPAHPPVAFSYSPPDYRGFRDWPTLGRIVAARWAEGHRWANNRKRDGIRAGLVHGPRTNTVVSDLERALGRTARPFSLDLIVLPVLEDEIRHVADDRYLVPERVYDSPDWPDLLRTLITPIA